ncbi:MAG: hypothetical protein DWI22_22155 [Planctomycetota bacterium]|nr:MAG: hypothetical protein DWI22_22155 [Planctomycetota bacterium]
MSRHSFEAMESNFAPNRRLSRTHQAIRTVADSAEIVFQGIVSPGNGNGLHDLRDRYVRFLQLDP